MFSLLAGIRNCTPGSTIREALSELFAEATK
jgi:hypothetical protein